MMGYNAGLGGMWTMGLFSLLTLAGLLVLAIWAMRTFIPGNRNTASPIDPLTQLKARLARGEITPDEYEEIRAHLHE